MRKRLNYRSPRGNGPNHSLLLRRMKNCSHYQSVEDVVKYLHSKYPEYKRMSGAVLSKNIQEALFKCESKNNDDQSEAAEVQQSTVLSLSSSSFESASRPSRAGQVSNPKLDLTRLMLRDTYSHDGLESIERNEIGEKEKANNMQVFEKEEDIESIKHTMMVEREPAVIGKKDLNGGMGGRVYPLFRDIHGMSEVQEELIYTVLFPLWIPALYKRLIELNAGPPTGILFHGPPGCGKTMLAQAIANEARVPLYQIASTEVVSSVSGQSEETIRQIFSKALKTSPSIIFIDEIDAIAGKREMSQKGMEGRIVTQLMKCMDTINIQELASPVTPEGAESLDLESTPRHVIVIGATNRPNALDPALRRPGRFNMEILVPAPDENGRFEILSGMTRNNVCQDGLDLRKMARDTHGFVGADLKELVSRASDIAAKKLIKARMPDGIDSSLRYEDDSWFQPFRFMHREFETFSPSMAEFEAAFKCVQPSLKREGFSEVPDVSWEDIGGGIKIRHEFQEYVTDPIKFPDKYKEIKDSLPHGFLLFGPPGCGKTLIAKAVANEAGASFIYTKAAELLNKYVGESELAVRELFARARMCSPCILFFDELDAFITGRGEYGVVHRVVKQLLDELDGAEKRQGVYIIGAANRPHLLDDALLRPRRFEKRFYVSLPSPDERGSILKAIARKMHVDASVDLLAIAKSEACQHFNGADLDELMRTANNIARKEMETSKHTGGDATQWTIYTSHLDKALMGMTPSVKKRKRKFYDRVAEKMFSCD